MHAACIRVLLLLALGAALLVAGSGYARRRRAVIKLISMACGLADKRRVSPHPGLVRLAQAAKVFDLVRVETGKTNCGTFFSGSWAWGLQSGCVCCVLVACGTGRGSLVFAWGGSRVAVRRSGVQSRVDSSGRQRRRSLCAREGEET